MISPLTQSSKLPAKKISIITEHHTININKHKSTIDELPTKHLPNSSSTKRPLSQTSANNKSDYVSLNDIDFMLPPVSPHKKIALTKQKSPRSSSPIFNFVKLEELAGPSQRNNK
ncbi:hypothetical protein K0M31_008911 [Melipona bicolor]|uniref:Uncharacterized protein n=1 Tax=Melipona bicolor TaxID=60889 RepID=A0AA40FQW5_9HYME|nr:hypothetical protein K0M31_008911 [Melipona bicolor]